MTDVKRRQNKPDKNEMISYINQAVKDVKIDELSEKVNASESLLQKTVSNIKVGEETSEVIKQDMCTKFSEIDNIIAEINNDLKQLSSISPVVLGDGMDYLIGEESFIVIEKAGTEDRFITLPILQGNEGRSIKIKRTFDSVNNYTLKSADGEILEGHINGIYCLEMVNEVVEVMATSKQWVITSAFGCY